METSEKTELITWQLMTTADVKLIKGGAILKHDGKELEVGNLSHPDLNISAAHEIAERLENTLDEEISRPVNITIHIEPDTPELRK